MKDLDAVAGEGLAAGAALPLPLVAEDSSEIITPPRQSGWRRLPLTIVARVGFTRSGKVGGAILALVVVLVVLGPLVAPHSPTETIGIPFAPPDSSFPFGTDVLGRDVLSRFLNGGRVMLAMAFASTIVAYTFAGVIGLTAGYRRGVMSHSIVWLTDVFLSIPAIVLSLAIIAALGTGLVNIGVAITVVLMPSIIRFVRIVTLEVSTHEYVEVAVARGDPTLTILVREILPNVRTPIAADFGIRLAWSIILFASLSFLGFGQAPPSPDWGVMIAENREGLTVSAWPVLAPALAIAALAVSVNLVADSVARSMGRSLGAGR